MSPSHLLQLQAAPQHRHLLHLLLPALHTAVGSGHNSYEGLQRLQALLVLVLLLAPGLGIPVNLRCQSLAGHTLDLLVLLLLVAVITRHLGSLLLRVGQQELQQQLLLLLYSPCVMRALMQPPDQALILAAAAAALRCLLCAPSVLVSLTVGCS